VRRRGREERRKGRKKTKSKEIYTCRKERINKNGVANFV
jgi:hypothetical protein